jgi:hypothetical protein
MALNLLVLLAGWMVLFIAIRQLVAESPQEEVAGETPSLFHGTSIGSPYLCDIIMTTLLAITRCRVRGTKSLGMVKGEVSQKDPTAGWVLDSRKSVEEMF